MKSSVNGAAEKAGNRKKTNKKVQVWAPDLFSITGGIQAFSRHLIEALRLQLEPGSMQVLVKNDLPDISSNLNGISSLYTYGHWSKTFRTPVFAVKCIQTAFLERPDLIVSTHLHFGPVAQIIRKCLGIPYVLIAHGIDAWNVNHQLQSALQSADLVLAVSNYTRERLIFDGGLNPDRVKILPNTFAPERFAINPKPDRLLEKYQLHSQTPVILTVCRLAEAERYKGYDQIIKAMPTILRALPDARYLLVGKGPDRPRIEKMIDDYGVRDSVIFAGFVPDEELIDYYNLCDIFAMPSKAEGFGIVYLEALACGKPVLAGNKDGSRDAVANGELGILIDPDDDAEIAREITSLLLHQHQHPNIYQSELLRRRAIELFGFDAFSQTLSQRLKPYL